MTHVARRHRWCNRYPRLCMRGGFCVCWVPTGGGAEERSVHENKNAPAGGHRLRQGCPFGQGTKEIAL